MLEGICFETRINPCVTPTQTRSVRSFGWEFIALKS